MGGVTHLGDAPVGLSVGGALEGGVPHQQLIAEHPQTPQVHLLVVGPTLHHLGGEVIQRPTHGLPPGGEGGGGALKKGDPPPPFRTPIPHYAIRWMGITQWGPMWGWWHLHGGKDVVMSHSLGPIGSYRVPGHPLCPPNPINPYVLPPDLMSPALIGTGTPL